ncbi:MAG: hypothetical protein Q7R92_04515 [bacterium]|nr:hypothetical protein [bacterium]
MQGDNIFGRPMYFPNETGKRVYLGKRYEKFLRHKGPNLLPTQPYAICAQVDPWSVAIPFGHIADYIDTRQELEYWLTSSDQRVGIVKYIFKEAGITIHRCGLGGSASLGCESSDNDIDLLIFGSSTVLLCKQAIESALRSGDLDLMTREIVSLYVERYARMYGLNQDYLNSVFSYDLTKVYYRGQKISFIFTYSEDERKKIPAILYARKSCQAPEICIKAYIIDNTASWLYPRKYIVKKPSGQTYQVWSHHWLKDPVTPAGTLVEVMGRNLGDGIISLTDMHHHIAP